MKIVDSSLVSGNDPDIPASVNFNSAGNFKDSLTDKTILSNDPMVNPKLEK